VFVTHSFCTKQTNSMVQDILWNVASYSALQTTVCFLYATRMFITVFTKPRHWTVYRAYRIQFAPSIPISLRPILMLSSHLRLCLPSGLFPSGLPTKTLCTTNTSPLPMRATYFTHILLDLITLTVLGEECRL